MALAGKILRALGILILASTLILWASTGFHRGWSKSYVEIEKIDPVTEIVFTEQVDRPVLGVDFLAAGAFSGIVLILVSLPLTRKKTLA